MDENIFPNSHGDCKGTECIFHKYRLPIPLTWIKRQRKDFRSYRSRSEVHYRFNSKRVSSSQGQLKAMLKPTCPEISRGQIFLQISATISSPGKPVLDRKRPNQCMIAAVLEQLLGVRLKSTRADSAGTTFQRLIWTYYCCQTVCHRYHATLANMNTILA